MNSAVVLVATAFSATALQVALRGAPMSAGDTLMLYALNSATWNAGGLFFGLWLIPMGWLTLRSAALVRLAALA